MSLATLVKTWGRRVAEGPQTVYEIQLRRTLSDGREPVQRRLTHTDLSAAVVKYGELLKVHGRACTRRHGYRLVLIPLGRTGMTYRKLTQAELVAEARARFGDDPMAWAFTCPNCGDVATPGDFAQCGVDPGRCGQECIGRHLGSPDRPHDDRGRYASRGCNWVAYGLIPGPWEIVLPAEDGRPERSIRGFPLAGASQPAVVAAGGEEP